jgi:hypothetical protein
MNGRYDLSGDFVECCDCFTICPCWVADLPDEDHCSGLYVWTFAEKSRIDGIDVSGMSIAAASFHAVRSGGQAMFFIDTGQALGTDAERAYHAILNTFTGNIDRADPGVNEGQLQALSKLLGTIIGDSKARIHSEFKTNSFHVSVTIVDGKSPGKKAKIAEATGGDWVFEGNATPMVIDHAALTDELGIQDKVRVQKMQGLTVNVAALPGSPLELIGRSGMRGNFHYLHRPTREQFEDEEEENEPGEEE